jgi:hypothetical protein
MIHPPLAAASAVPSSASFLLPPTHTHACVPTDSSPSASTASSPRGGFVAPRPASAPPPTPSPSSSPSGRQPRARPSFLSLACLPACLCYPRRPLLLPRDEALLCLEQAGLERRALALSPPACFIHVRVS